MIHIENRFPTPLEAGLLERAAQLALQSQSSSLDADLTIVLDDDEALRELNLDYRDVDAPTDVLSFPANEADPETGISYLGDIIISIERAQEQAAAAGHLLEAELQLLVVHGVLHLLGHDHADPDQKQRMWSVQALVLSQLGLSGIKISE
jgi:probable rRNA maturation factor